MTLVSVVSNPKISALAIVQASGFIPIRVDAGGPAYTDSQGNLWSADTGYQGGNTDALGVGTSISNTADPTLYQTERWNSGSLVYSFAVPNGSYTVTLKFAEIYFASPGQRICNIVLNGTTVKANFDIVAAAGAANRAYDLSYPVTVTGGQITVTLVSVVSNPKISALAIVQASAFTPIRVNAGGPAYTDSQGNLWSADTGYQGGNTDALGAGTSISNTADPTLYQTERCRGPQTQYVPNPQHTYYGLYVKPDGKHQADTHSHSVGRGFTADRYGLSNTRSLSTSDGQPRAPAPRSSLNVEKKTNSNSR